ncbi:MAG: fibronectin type III domain-containing protein [Gammaproteobacteria bacterium]|nr:fibronectin type III domain-containing protein [Gammaproteobacteria bacterium]
MQHGLAISPGATATKIIGLAPGTTYQVRMKALDADAFQSPWSATAQGTTAAAAPSAPSAELFTRTDDSLALRWGAPHDGGRDITGYKVRWADASSPANYLNTGGASGVDASGGANARRYVLENLTAGTTYQAQVRALNSAGDSDWSAVQERILPLKSGIKAAICIHPVGARPGTFDECLQAARNGYTISESAGGAQRFEITIFFFEHFPEDVGVLTLDLQTRNDPVNPLVANTDTDGALPAINGIRRSPNRPLQHFTFPAFAITPKTSGDGGRINIAFSTSTDIDKFQTLPAEERQDTFLQIAEAGVNFTAPDSNNACPAANNAAVSSVEVAEAGNAKTVCVSLKSDPGESVSVSCAALPNALGETTVSASPAKLSFTSANRRRGQALTLTAPDNNSAFAASTMLALRCTASGGIGSDYSALVEELAITLTDADVVSTSGAALSVTGALSKNGGAQEVKITATLGGDIVPGEACTVATAFGASKLSNSPSASLAVSGTDYTAFTAPSITIPAGKNTASTTLSITPSTSVSEIKSIPFTAANISCGLSTVTFAAAEVLIVDAAVVITDCSDNDSTTLELEEGAAAENICVKLAGNAPSSNVTVTCSGAADPAALTSAQTGTFTTANFETEQTFPIVAVDNNLAFSTAPTDTLTCTAAADVSTGYSGLTDEITVTVKDDTAPDTISTAGATLSFTHVSTSRTGTVVAIAALDGDIAPQEDCTVTLTKGSAAIADTRGDALAVEGTDYDAFTAPSITIPAGSLFGKATFHPTVERNTGRDKKSIPFSGAAASCGDATNLAFAEAEVLILNPSPLVTQADADGTCPATHNDPIAQPLPVTEGVPVTVCISLPLDPAEFDPGATPKINCSGHGGTETIRDGRSTVGLVTIASGITGGDTGDWNLGRAIGIIEPDDNVAEGDRVIAHTCSASTERGFGPYNQTNNAGLEFSITDADAVAATGGIAGAVREGGGAQTVTITADIDGGIAPPADCALTVSIGSSAISGTRGDKLATATAHYTGTLTAPAVTISGRETSGDATLSITPVVDGDNDIESIPLTATAACGGKGTFVSVDAGSNNGSDTITFTGELLIGDAAPSLSAPVASSGELSLTWRAPVVEVGGTVHTAYKVRWADAGDASSYLNTGEESGLDVPGGATAISYTVSGLTDGTTYQVQVGAVYGGGDAHWSFARESVPGELPGAPRNLTSTVGDGTITPAWDAPADDGGAAISGYRVRHSEGAGSSNWQPDADGATATETEYEISGLTNGTTYEIQVAAVNALGTGAWASHQTSPVAPPPDAPTGVTVSTRAGLLQVSWVAPANTGDEALTDYAVRYSEGAGSSNWLPDDDGLATASTNLAYDLTGVKSATTYEVQVAARNRAGPGPFTASVQSVTPEFDPDINGDSSVTWQDGILIARHLAGVRGANLIADMGGTNLNADNVAAHIAAGVAAGDLDMDGANGTTLADGIMLTRYLLGMRAGDGITTRMSATAEATVISNIEALVQ